MPAAGARTGVPAAALEILARMRRDRGGIAVAAPRAVRGRVRKFALQWRAEPVAGRPTVRRDVAEKLVHAHSLSPHRFRLGEDRLADLGRNIHGRESARCDGDRQPHARAAGINRQGLDTRLDEGRDGDQRPAAAAAGDHRVRAAVQCHS